MTLASNLAVPFSASLIVAGSRGKPRPGSSIANPYAARAEALPPGILEPERQGRAAEKLDALLARVGHRVDQHDLAAAVEHVEELVGIGVAARAGVGGEQREAAGGNALSNISPLPTRQTICAARRTDAGR